MKGLNIEKKSFEIIEKNVDLSKFNESQKQIAKRVIHASGDFEFAKLIRFSNDAVDVGVNAIKEHWNVVCDVNMVRAGITEEFAKKCNLNLYCFIRDKFVSDFATKYNKTKAESSIIYANKHFDKIIFVIGNAPTALLEIINLNKSGLLKPSFIVAFPVGFVDAAYSKELLLKSNLNYITNIGTKGGSAVAASAFRALMKLACKEL